MLRIHTEADWTAIGITSVHLRFFYERWQELLDASAPVSNRAWIAGAPEILRELQSVRERYGDAAHGMGAVRALEEEAFGLTPPGQHFQRVAGTVESDEIAKRLVGHLLEQREKASSLSVGGSPPAAIAEARREATLRVMASVLNRDYLRAVVEGLRSAIFDTPPSPDNAKRLERLTGVLVTELLAVGFAESFLRVHARTLTTQPGHEASERERFDYFVARLVRPEEEFRVILRLQGRSDLWEGWPTHLSKVQNQPTELAPDASISGDWAEFGAVGPAIRFTELVVMARDHHTATRYAVQEFQRHADLAVLGSPQADPSILAVATVREVPPGKVAIAESKQLELGSVPVHRTSLREGGRQKVIADVLGSQDVAEDAKRRLSGALRYYRISVGQPWSESGLTNLWTALEVLASEDFGDNIIDRVVRSVVPLLAAGKVRDLVADLVGYLLVAGVRKDAGYRAANEAVFEQERLVPHLLLGAVSQKDQALELARPFMQQSPLLVSRIMRVAELFESGATLANHVHRTAQRIEWNIRRLYRQRNDAVHGAALGHTTTRMLGYLRLYVYETAVIQSGLLAANNSLSTIEGVVAAADAAYHHWLQQLLTAGRVAEMGADGWRWLYERPYDPIRGPRR